MRTLSGRNLSLKDEAGAFDLTSVLVGAAVVAILVGGTFLTLFGVIPWSQDHAARQDLAAIRTAESISKVRESAFKDGTGLQSDGHLTIHSAMNVAAPPDGSCYVAVRRSDTGNVYYTTDQKSEPALLTKRYNTGCLDKAGVQALADTVGGLPSSMPLPPVMATTWNTSGSCTTIKIPVYGTVNVNVDWGDGTTSKVTTSYPAHTYTDGLASHKVTVDGTFTRWGQTGPFTASWTPACLTDVNEWGETGTTDLTSGFANATNLRTVDRIPATTTTLSQLFWFAQNFNDDVNDWETSNVTAMNEVFRGARSFNQDLTNWDTSQATSMAGMFESASAFNGDISNWDTFKVKSVDSMFLSASSFNGDISKWNTASVTNMQLTFQSATAFNADISKWNTSSVTNMQQMLYQAPAFSRDLTGWNVAKVTSKNNFATTPGLDPSLWPKFP